MLNNPAQKSQAYSTHACANLLKAHPNVPKKNHINPHLRILGHRGARAEYIENSRLGFDYVQNLFYNQHKPYPKYAQLHGIEFDVQLTADKQLVVLHDDDLVRLYGKQSRIDQLTVAQLNKITNHQPIMRLVDLWPLLQGYLHIELEIKTHSRSDINAIIQALCQSLPFDGLPITLTCFNTQLHSQMLNCSVLSHYTRGLLVGSDEAIQYIKNSGNRNINNSGNRSFNKIINDHNVYQNLSTNLSTIANLACQTATRLGCQHVGMFYPLIDESTIELCARYDLTLSAWTVNDPATIVKLCRMHIDYIITDYPTAALSLKEFLLSFV